MNANISTPVAISPSGRLFEDDATPDSAAGAAPKEPATQGRPRLRYAQRHQYEFRDVVLDGLLPPEHQVRLVWDYVCQLDLTVLLQPIRAVAGAPGRDATDPRILLCLWLFATLEGV